MTWTPQPHTRLGATTCNGHNGTCTATVMCLENHQNTALCITCGRQQAGITWTASQPIGQWHPTTGYPVIHPPDNRKPANTKTEWAWSCIDCAGGGNAVSEPHAHTALTMHRAYACPYLPGLTTTDITIRITRRRPLSALYPHEMPWVHQNKQGQPVKGPAKETQ